VAIGDFNGDGQNDLAVANRDSSNVSILLATGPGTFGPATSVAAGTESRFVAIGNFNGDALSDLAVANRISDNVSILLATGPGTFYESDCQGRSSSLLKAFRSLWQSALTVVVTTNVSA
jgi:hypothetical protein